jgi:hypothetical protein
MTGFEALSCRFVRNEQTPAYAIGLLQSSYSALQHNATPSTS